MVRGDTPGFCRTAKRPRCGGTGPFLSRDWQRTQDSGTVQTRVGRKSSLGGAFRTASTMVTLPSPYHRSKRRVASSRSLPVTSTATSSPSTGAMAVYRITSSFRWACASSACLVARRSAWDLRRFRGRGQPPLTCRVALCPTSTFYDFTGPYIAGQVAITLPLSFRTHAAIDLRGCDRRPAPGRELLCQIPFAECKMR